MATVPSRSALRPFNILDAFCTAKRPLSLSEMAQLANIPISTCHSVMHSMEQQGLLYFLSPRETYPTRRLWDMARIINSNDPIATRCLPFLTALRDATNETVILGTRQDDRVLYLVVVESGQTIRYSSRAGDFKPMHSSAIGKVLLSTMPNTELSAWLKSHELIKATSSTITSVKRLMENIDATRDRGYSVTHGENVEDVMAIAAPLQRGSMTLGLAVAGPLNRMSIKVDDISRQLLSCIQEISL